MNPKSVSMSIAHGHAYTKHVKERNEFPRAKSQDEFAGLVEEIIRNPSERRKLTRGREAFWDQATQAVVIVDLNNPDFGTAFVPKRGKAYFEGLAVEEAS